MGEAVRTVRTVVLDRQEGAAVDLVRAAESRQDERVELRVVSAGACWTVTAERRSDDGGAKLLPDEYLALKIASAQIQRGKNPPINITTTLVTAVERLSQ